MLKIFALTTLRTKSHSHPSIVIWPQARSARLKNEKTVVRQRYKRIIYTNVIM